MSGLVEELKRRKIVQVAAVYGVITWLLVQIAATIEEPLALPGWTDTLVIVLLALGFPVTLIISWVFNVTDKGLERDPGNTPPGNGKGMEYGLIAVLAIAVGWLLYRDWDRDLDRGTEGPDQSVAVTESAVTEASNLETLIAETAAADLLPNSIAVLPFSNFSPDPDNAFFAAGIHDTILHELAKLKDLHVISRTTMARFAETDLDIAEIASQLRVETVMEGSVQYANGRVLVTAQLIDPQTNAHLWSGNYDREFADIFTIQSEVAARIAEAMQAQLTPQESADLMQPSTTSAEAYALYLRFMEGIEWDFSPGDATAANIALLDQAIAIDPGFADAWAAKAFAYSYSLAGYEAALENAEQALRLDAGNAMAHAALAHAYEREGRFDDAQLSWEKAYALNPRNPDILDDYWRFQFYLEPVDEARVRQLIAELLLYDPDRHSPASVAYLNLRDFESARDAAEAAVRINPNGVGPRVRLAWLENRLENHEGAQVQLAIAKSLPVPAISAATTYTIFLSYTRTALQFQELGEDEYRRRFAGLAREAYAMQPAEFLSSLGDIALLVYAERDEPALLARLQEILDDIRQRNSRFYVDFMNSIVYNDSEDPLLERPEIRSLREQIRVALTQSR